MSARIRGARTAAGDGDRVERKLDERYSLGMDRAVRMVETRRLELLTLSLQRRCSAS
jgi:hypothetical protein